MSTNDLCARCGQLFALPGQRGYCPRCFADISGWQDAQMSGAVSTPGWTLSSAIGVMIFFTMAILIIPYVGILFWAVLGHFKLGESPAAMLSDPTVVLVGVSSAFVAHGLTLLLAWMVATQFRRRSFTQAVGWQWHPRFRWPHAAITVAGFLGFVYGLSKILPSGKTEFDKLLEASASVRIVVAILAVGTAPLVEELVYRGLLFASVAARYGTWTALVSVTLIFAGVHFWQYGASKLILVSITLLSLLLTSVRALTGKLLPSYAIHLLYNATVAGLILFSH